ncbi:MAG: hypothetical protein Q4A19_01975 [Johnsonella sp.]|nr:hypothetical protein [Johnsonella sp.]
MLLVFEKLPETMEEFMKSPYAGLEKPEYTAALFIAAMSQYEANPELALEMLRYLKGPGGLSVYEKQFIADRLRGKAYVVRSYFKGSSPENDYTPLLPYTVEITENPYSYDQKDHAKFFMRSSGADSPRPIQLRLKPSASQWFLTEQLLLGGIRIPVSQDPWA